MGIEPMIRTGLNDQRSNHWPIEAQSSDIVFFCEWYFMIESILRGADICDTLRYSEAISYQAKMMLNDCRVIRGKYDYSKEWKGVDVSFIYNSKILHSLTFDVQPDKKRYASTGNRSHGQHWFTSQVL